jgi:long-chain acyl-CoA synthetase
MNLATVLTETSARKPDRIALRLGEATISYRELDSARVAARPAAHAVSVGDRVGVVLPNVPEFAAVYYGVLRTGEVPHRRRPVRSARRWITKVVLRYFSRAVLRCSLRFPMGSGP